MVKQIKDSLEKIDTDGLPMGEKTVEEYICGRYWNPYPTVRYTERPDTAAVYLYEGHVLVIIDGSPSVLITPATYWHHLQHIEEYRQRPVVGSYFRLVRYLAVWISIFLLPVWFLLVDNQHMLPDALAYLGPKEPSVVPLIVQLILIELGMDILKMATIHTPTSMATAIGLVAAVIIGQIAVSVGLFTNEAVLYLSVVAIATFATPTYELGLANRIFRLALLLATAAFGVTGYVGSITLWVLFLVSLKSFYIPYFWPFIPFSYQALKDTFLRAPIPLNRRRPTATHPQDSDR